MMQHTAYRFRLEPTATQAAKLTALLGSARYVWNQVLALSFDMYAKGEHINTDTLVKLIPTLKEQPDNAFLKDHSNAVTLQQKVRDLGAAWAKFFNKKEQERIRKLQRKPKKRRVVTLADGTELSLFPLMPHFKRKSDGRDSIRLVQFDRYCERQGNRVKLPNQIGFVKFRKSRKIFGKIKNVTISKQSGHWYVSFLSERQLREKPAHPSTSAIGIDVGVNKLLVTSEGKYFPPVNSFKTHQASLAKLQRQLAKKEKFSQNWEKIHFKIQRLHHRVANIRRDYLQKITTELSKNHAMIIVEDLKVMNMSASGSGTLDAPGKHVKAKSGLNRSILDQGWGMMVNMLEYKQAWRGGWVTKVNPRYTSQRCSQCQHVAKANRTTQAGFKCVSCGYEANADLNAACNILTAGLMSGLSVEERCSKDRPVKQKTCEIRKENT